mmetsp:Transcript_18143/g.27219  ORF Transcript_18143/g.27219 Transcript_18143/m.27219 type:complete len:847 (+) Transcript_18143:3-2543(+)
MVSSLVLVAMAATMAPLASAGEDPKFSFRDAITYAPDRPFSSRKNTRKVHPLAAEGDCEGPAPFNLTWKADRTCIMGPEKDGTHYRLGCPTDSSSKNLVFVKYPKNVKCTGTPETNITLPLETCIPAQGATGPYHFQFHCNGTEAVEGIYSAEPAACEKPAPSNITWKADGSCIMGPEGDGTHYRLGCPADKSSNKLIFIKYSKDAGGCTGVPETNTTLPLETCIPSEGATGPYHFKFHCNGTQAIEGIYPGAGPSPTIINFNVSMRDGKKLYTNVYLPPGTTFANSSSLPVVYVQCPYDSREGGCTWVEQFWMSWNFPPSPAMQKFTSILVQQESRGTWRSAPEMYKDAIFWQYSTNDAHDTTKWIKSQSWNNHVVMIHGLSAGAVAGILAANSGEEYAAYDLGIGGQFRVHDTTFRGGALNNASTTYISGALAGPADPEHPDFKNPNMTKVLELYEELFENEAPGGLWNTTRFRASSSWTWPSNQIAGWYDLFDQVSVFEDIVENSKWDVRCSHILQVLPLGHCGETSGIPGAGGFSELLPWNQTAVKSIFGIHTALTTTFFNLFDGSKPRWLSLLIWQGILHGVYPGVPKVPKRIWYVLSSAPYPEGNFIAQASEFPEPQMTKMYLDENENLSFDKPSLGPNTTADYKYLPSDPMPSYGGHLFYNPDPSAPVCGPQDQSKVLKGRSDFGFWQTIPLDKSLCITGRITATLKISSSAPDTDFIVKLLDVWTLANGTEVRMALADGVTRMRWRDESQKVQDPLIPGQIYTAVVDLWQMSWLIPKGHRVGLLVTSSNTPLYDVNPNNGLPLNKHGKALDAVNSIYLGESFVTLPVVDRTNIEELHM